MQEAQWDAATIAWKQDTQSKSSLLGTFVRKNKIKKKSDNGKKEVLQTDSDLRMTKTESEPAVRDIARVLNM